ncbi:2-succinyl-5-enolpyruvyl-6-hydroxy-3-cyclohexene-1-carboxylic-acid synthase [Bacillus aquiflavi]|nr:2-succinyl-5-enolpyruvyl-6-hydroxy-3-cyclohexene-1-carboxylic-acid synthase [Bacillus aquiflavi]
MSHLEALTAYTAAFVAELVKAGVEDVIISPGSRSTPLAMMMAEHPDLKIRIHVDERSAAFFALGIAKASEKPTVLLCTSGTAAANYYPAVIEAKYARVPLIVLTADRPHELRDVGAPQAIDQIHLYGKNVKWFVEMALPENSQDMIRYARTVCTRAVTVASRTPAGPVHLNFPFREPLIPDLERENLFELTERPHGCMNIHTGILSLQAEDAETIATELNNYEKGLIICGPIEDCTLTEKIVELADALQYPIIADPLSQMRSGKHCGEKIVTSYDTFLKNEKAQKLLKPEVIIRFGEMPTSKALLFFLKKHRSIRQFIIDGGGGWRDPSGTGTDMVCCDEKAFCQSITNYLVVKNSTKWLNKWLEIDAVTQRGLLQINQQSSLSEGKLFSLLAKILPNHSTLFVGNSMPIRDLDTFFHFNNKSIRIMGNRGANGIDGIVSTALGAATVSEPLYLIVGDLTFFHDLNGLLAAKLYNINIKIILINNNGGGIFSFLPQSKHAANFEKLFGTPLNLDF